MQNRAGTGEENRAEIPVRTRKNAAARVQEKKPRGNTRQRAEKWRRAGTGEKTTRKYPSARGKNGAARVQERKSRGNTRQRAEKCRRAGTEEETARKYTRTWLKAIEEYSIIKRNL